MARNEFNPDLSALTSKVEKVSPSWRYSLMSLSIIDLDHINPSSPDLLLDIMRALF
jgi:hypothetical protein